MANNRNIAEQMRENPDGVGCSYCGTTVPAKPGTKATVCWRCTDREANRRANQTAKTNKKEKADA